MKYDVKLKEIEEQVLEGTAKMTTEEYLEVFNKLDEEERIKRLEYFISFLNYPKQKDLVNVEDYLKFIKKVIDESIPIQGLTKTEYLLYKDLEVGRLTVPSYKFLFQNLWQIKNMQLVNIDTVEFEDLYVSATIKDLIIAIDGKPSDTYVEFVLRSYTDKKKLDSYITKFKRSFYKRAGYEYLKEVNAKLHRKKGNYVDYKDIKVCDCIYNRDSNVVLVKIGVRDTYKVQPSDINLKKEA